MESVKFVIDEMPFACWDWELQKKNLEFLEGVDSDYFRYVAETNIENLEGENKHRAALALRLAYSQGLEALFAFLCSAIQAPQCSIGWILSYRNLDLINVVKKVSRREHVFTRFKNAPITWNSIAKHVYAGLGYEAEKLDWIQNGFGKLWAWFASDITDDSFMKEYNGIKHGLRVCPGGFDFSVGIENTPGVPAPPEKMTSLGGSIFGSSYFVKEHMIPLNKTNFRPRRHSRNWSPENLINGLILISMSLNNVISFLRIVNGISPDQCNFHNPTTKEGFEDPWKQVVGINHVNLDLIIEEENIVPISKEEILNSYIASEKR